MMRIKLVFLLAACFTIIQCSGSPTGPNVRDLDPLEKQLVSANNEFGFNLFHSIDAVEQQKNLFISPLSVSMALGMTLNGAAGETREAMRSVLAFAGMDDEAINQSYRSLIDLLVNLDPEVTMQIANSIWTRQGVAFRDDFLNANKTYFDALVQGLDFGDPASVSTINQWVKDNTNGKIDKIIEHIDQETVMFLINAIYFKGTWTFQFDKELTADEPFFLADGSQKTVPMMHLSGDLNYFGNDLFQAVDLPYGSDLYNMMILLPRPGTDLEAVVAALSAENWQAWSGVFKTTAVDLALPKFKLEYEIRLNDVLTSMGMGVAFDAGRADFTRMYEGPDRLFISKVKHKTFLEVDEEGTEAAAATVVEVGRTSVPQNTPVRVDHPFVFLIHDRNSGTIVFMGKMLNPQS